MTHGPVLIGSYRCGSRIVCRLLANIARLKYNHRNNLYEFFDTLPYRYFDYMVVNVHDQPTIVLREFKHLQVRRWTTEQEHETLRLHLLGLLQQTGPHTMKVFPNHMNNMILNYLNTHYNLIFLERRNKFSQVISFLAMRQMRTTHYKTTDMTVVPRIVFNVEDYDFIIKNITDFKRLQAKYNQQPTIYYEDFVGLGSNQQALLKLLKIADVLTEPIITTRPTLYQFNEDNIFADTAEWRQNRERVIEETRLLSVPV